MSNYNILSENQFGEAVVYSLDQGSTKCHFLSMCCLPGEEDLQSLHLWEVRVGRGDDGRGRTCTGVGLQDHCLHCLHCWCGRPASGISCFPVSSNFTTTVPSMSQELFGWGGYQEASSLLPHSFPSHCLCFPGPHSSFRLYRHKFPFFSSSCFCSRPDCLIMRITARQLGPRDPPSMFPVIQGTGVKLRTPSRQHRQQGRQVCKHTVVPGRRCS